MAMEIERKFLVKGDAWRALAKMPQCLSELHPKRAGSFRPEH
jgi:CYTH domain-containing protein